MSSRTACRWAEPALAGVSALALADALFHLAPASPPDWAALWNTLTALPWGGPLWLLLRTALALAATIL